jgi:hypothetical protein
MRRHVDKLALLFLCAVLAIAVHASARFGKATAKPTGQTSEAVNNSARSLSLDRSSKFDLLFGDPDLARP